MFGKKVVQDSAEENVLSKKEGNKKKIIIFSSVAALLLVGFLVGKASMNGEYKNAQETGKNAQGVIKDISSKNAQLQDEIKRLQNIIVERNNKEQELAKAFQTAISIKDALSVINNKISAVRANAQRIKSSYISDNPEVRNLDSKVIGELLNVVDIDTNKQLQILGQAIKTLNDYQKNQAATINSRKQNDLQAQDNQTTPVVSKKEPVSIQEDNKAEIEPLDFNGSNF